MVDVMPVRLCRWLSRVNVLLFLGVILLVILWLLRGWLGGLLQLALLFLIWLGLLLAATVAAAIVAKYCRRKESSPKGKGSVGAPWTPSKTIPSHTYKRPDPLIYSQGYLMAKGLAVTWDNPDIQLFDGATPVPSHDILPAKTYRVAARIWNGSTDGVAVNMLVKFYYLTFGIGASRTFIAQAFVNVPVKGSPALPALVEVDWPTPSTPGHYCLQAELNWPDDANPDNNLGQENITIKKLNSPNATFTFPLRNDSAFARTLRLEADGYAIPAREPCPDRRPADAGQRQAPACSCRESPVPCDRTVPRAASRRTPTAGRTAPPPRRPRRRSCPTRT